MEDKLEARFQELEEKLKNLTQEDRARVRDAFDYARSHHEGQLRKDGSPYITHPLEVAHLVAELGLDADSIMAALLHDTIEDTDATHEEVVAAAKAARCHDFITALPDGYDTIIGESGATISGGERQRISIARALLKDAPVVVLDEATAHADPESEETVQRSIDKLVSGRTLIVVAHRLSTIMRAQNIVVIDRGRIVAQGTHEKLLEGCELYRHMWKAHVEAMDWTVQGEEAVHA